MLHINDLTYRIGGRDILSNASAHVPAGHKVGVVGRNGAGKSTLTNLLLRFYDVQKGSVQVDGVDVRQWDLDALRSAIAIVLQDVFLFSGNVAENIHLGETSIDDEKLRWAAKEVHALEFIETCCLCRLEPGAIAAIYERTFHLVDRR